MLFSCAEKVLIAAAETAYLSGMCHVSWYDATSLAYRWQIYWKQIKKILANAISAIQMRIGRVSLARENEAGGSWGHKVHILHVNV